MIELLSTLRRTSAAGLALALLLTFLGFAGPPAHADPAIPDVPYEIGTGKAPVAKPPVPLPFDSVEYLLTELGWERGAEPGDDVVTWGDRRFTEQDLMVLAQNESNKTKSPELKNDRGKYKVGTVEHAVTRWFEYYTQNEDFSPTWDGLDAGERAAAFREWLEDYVRMQDNHTIGGVGEALVDDRRQLSAKGYRHDARFNADSKQRFDFYLPEGDERFPDVVKVIEEVKKGRYSLKQFRAYLEWAIELGADEVNVTFLYELTKGKIKNLQNLNAEYAPRTAANIARAAAGQPIQPLLRLFSYPITPDPRRHSAAPPPPGGPAPGTGTTAPPPPPGSLTGPGQVPAGDPGTETLTASPDSPEDAAREESIADQLARTEDLPDGESAEMTGDRLGGVDFSTLELRYVADTYDDGYGTGVDYAYQVDPAPGEEVSFGGADAAKLAADAFFTWLVLPPASFTVNLNPDEPDRIVEERLGRTDAGRVLLEADLQMKKSVATLIHPDGRLGGEFWDSLHGETKCISMRQWIVPKPAVVKEKGNALFILDAPLEVKMETEYLKTKGVGGSAGCEGQSTSDTEYNEGVYRRLILPELEKTVNDGEAYADLRRVYASRVAAEWYRDRSRTKTTAYSGIIDSGDASAWPLRVKWSPRDTFDRYVDSYKNGEFRVERTTRQGRYLVTNVYVYGGVNFADVPSTSLSDAEFAAEHPDLDAAVVDARLGVSAEEGTGVMFLGGRSTARPLWDPLPPPPSPLDNPMFYILTALPVVAWLVLGAFLWRRRPRPPAVAQGPISAGRVTP
ncbi:hypothetical protein Afil01_29180 [Actinorhabdospora filicis]|uniref:DUF3068 domain-containing protein n=1 Tax=Actinorhabdospora filicis TaxID=1785913 RepID=A0A9W6WA09_9ACTN|nr:hypothetical protein [Actinorhabdospora filicis]GLZ78111.1 hypothetical protein Afil01_29180 [Actinorhabdospora filicis]